MINELFFHCEYYLSRKITLKYNCWNFVWIFTEHRRVSICNVSTHLYIYRWTSVNLHGIVQFAINRHYMNHSLLMGMSCGNMDLYLRISAFRFTNHDWFVHFSYFQEVLQSSRLPPDINEIQLLNDGSWTVHDSNADASCLDTPRKSTQKVEVISDDIGKVLNELIYV